MLKQLNVKAIAVGFIVGFLVCMLAGVAYVINAGIVDSREMLGRPVVMYGAMALGFACAFIGGYVAARIAKQQELTHASATVLFWYLFFLLSLMAPTPPTVAVPAWYTILSWLLPVAAALLGGLAARRADGRTAVIASHA